MIKPLLATAAAACAFLLPARPALAQRTTDNAITQAEDAFGKSVGNERIGIYSPDDVRGFSPVDAGNVRMEGLYFDQQAGPDDRLVDGATVRVGLTAQGYPFPAPTGIADYALRKPGKDAVAGTVLTAGPFGSTGIEVDGQLPVDGERFGVALGASAQNSHQNFGSKPHYRSAAIIPVWRPSPGVEVIAFASRLWFSNEGAQTLVFPAGGDLPPRVKRGRYTGQPWEKNRGTNGNYGLLATVPLAGFVVRAGVFRSIAKPDKAFADLLIGVDKTGRAADRLVIADPGNRYASTSGELRVSRSFIEGARRHTVIASVRARDLVRDAGGAAVASLGPAQFGVPDYVPEPDFVYGPATRDKVRQVTGGLAYQGVWKNVGELNLGLQKTDYRKAVTDPSQILPVSRDRPWLISAAGAAYLSKALVLYAGYTRGLEESPIAPDIAVNRNEAPPAIRTRQADAGIRLAILPNLKAVAGVFQVTKPYYNVDAANRFRMLGAVRHRGIELSLSGRPIKGLSIVAGTILLDAAVSGEEVSAGLIGPHPVGITKRYTVVSFDYSLARPAGLSFDGVLESTGDRYADSTGTLIVPPRAVLSLGSRYRFKVGRTPALVRVQVANLFDRYGYGIGGSGFLVYNSQRRAMLTVAADL